MAIIAKYKFNQNTYADLVPVFNNGFTSYTVTDTIDADGYTIRTIESDSLPTIIRFGTKEQSPATLAREQSLLEVIQLNTDNLTDANAMFRCCQKIEHLDLSSCNFSKATIINYLCADCRALQSVKLPNLKNAPLTNMDGVFYGCRVLTEVDVSNINTKNVTDMANIFRDCQVLTSIKGLEQFDTQSATSMHYMFFGCKALTKVDVSKWNVGKVTTFTNMFHSCGKLTHIDVSSWNTSKAIDMSTMFFQCTSLQELDLSRWDTSRVLNMCYMFAGCKSLVHLDLSSFNTEKVEDMKSMFYSCDSLVSLDISNFNVTSCTEFSYMFNENPSLQHIAMLYGSKDDINTLSQNISTTLTIWYQDANLLELTQYDNITFKKYESVEVQQDIDSIPLTSDMFEQGVRTRGMRLSLQQCPLTTNSARISSKTLIPVKPGSRYTVSGINTSVNHIWGDMFDKDGLVCYDSVLDLTGGISSGTGVFVPHDVHYLCIKIKNADESAISPSILDSMNLIIQEVPQEIVLRGIGSVKDELDLTRGEYIQRIGEIKLADQKNIGSGSKTSETWFEALVYLDAYIKVANNGTTKIINNKLPLVRDTSLATTSYLRNNAGANNYIVAALTIEDMGGLTGYDGWNYYVKNNDVVIQYELETPIIHKVNLTNTKVIPSYATETHYETITPSDSLIPNITIPSTLNYDVAIKPSTEYTIRANTSDNLTVDLGGATGTLSNGKVTLTTPATLTHSEVKFSGNGKVKELMVVEGNEIKDNVPFFNGMKNVEMGGIKLVNVCRGMYTWNTGFITLNTNYNQIAFTDKGSYGNIQFDETLLKSHTTYTVYFNITENTSTITSPIGVTLSQTNGKETSTYPIISAKQTGIMSFTITTDEVAKTPRFVVKSGSTDSKITIKNAMIIEGDWTHLDEIPFIESEMIIDQPIIRSQGKNLFDGVLICASIADATGELGNINENIPHKSTLNYIRVNSEQKLFVSFTSENGYTGYCKMYCYDKNKKFLNKTINISANYTDDVHRLINVSEDSSVGYVRLRFFSGDGTVVQPKNIIISNSEASYEPYKHQTLYSNRVIGYEEGCYYIASNGNKVTTNRNLNSVKADVEGLSIAYISKTSSNYVFWDKDGVFISGKATLDTANGLTDKDGFIIVPSNAKYLTMAVSNKDTNRLYTDTTVTGDLPLRSLPNGVCDTLNLVTGEYVQRVGEVVFDGSEIWSRSATAQSDKYRVYIRLNNIKNIADNNTKNILICDKYTNVTADNTYNLWKGISLEKDNGGGSALIIYDEQFSTITNNIEFQEYLQSNPITVQYELATPIVRKLGFTTKGNYASLTLSGGEDLYVDGNINNENVARFEVKVLRTGKTVYYNPNLSTVWFGDLQGGAANTLTSGQVSAWGGDSVMFAFNKHAHKVTNLQEFKQWLALNSSVLGFLTKDQTSTSYSNIHKPIFFNNVDVQYLPNNVGIQPELILQARTRNSYVMDMMKPNTTYTMKCLAYSDSARLWLSNGTANVSVATNKSFSFGQLHLDDANNQLVIVGQWYEPMIIEGDVTGKNLPYFKGILSSYHDADEIELYSVNKNLFDMSKVKPYDEVGTHWWNTIVKENEVVSVRSGNIEAGQFGAYATLDVRPNSVYTLYMEMEKDGEPYNGQIYGYENDKVWGNGTFTGYANTMYHLRTSQNAKYITIGFNYGKDFPIGTTFVSKNMRLYLGEESPVYIPHAHNTTLIEMPTRLETVKVVRPAMEEGMVDTTNGVNMNSTTSVRSNYIPVKPNEFICIKNGSLDRLANIVCYDINKTYINYLLNAPTQNGYVPNNCYFIRIYMSKSNCSDLTITRQAWKPIQLNSLPNGVCDEIIMKPNSNKAQLVQRVGKVVLDGNAPYYKYDINSNAYCQWYTDLPNAFAAYVFSDTLPTFTERTGILGRGISGKGGTGYYVWFNIESAIATTESVLKTYLQQNPITVYYELATPIIHEIQLKGYPHAYEDGTVTFNTDTPHQTLVSYNVNQEQLINTQNETIIRHDQQIDDLYYYIELYLEEIYQMELFRMQVELSL